MQGPLQCFSLDGRFRLRLGRQGKRLWLGDGQAWFGAERLRLLDGRRQGTLSLCVQVCSWLERLEARGRDGSD
jgi:hypothetical protein